MHMPTAGEDVAFSYGEHGKGNLLSRVISCRANDPRCTAVVERARALNLVRLPVALTAPWRIHRYGKETIVGIADIRVTVWSEVAERLRGISLLIQRTGEVPNTLTGRSEAEGCAICPFGRRPLNLDDETGTETGLRYDSTFRKKGCRICSLIAGYLLVTDGFEAWYSGTVPGHRVRASRKFVCRTRGITLPAATINTVGQLQRVCALSNDHVFILQRWSTFAVACITTSFDGRAAITFADTGRNIQGR